MSYKQATITQTCYLVSIPFTLSNWNVINIIPVSVLNLVNCLAASPLADSTLATVMFKSWEVYPEVFISPHCNKRRLIQSVRSSSLEHSYSKYRPMLLFINTAGIDSFVKLQAHCFMLHSGSALHTALHRINCTKAAIRSSVPKLVS